VIAVTARCVIPMRKVDAVVAAQWRRKTVEEAHAVFRSLGLVSDFWKLS
jgi:hypothetical protein